MVNCMIERDYTFCLEPGEKKRYIAGPYNPQDMAPSYEIIINAPQHVKQKILCEQILVGNPEKCSWAYDLENKSKWLAFVIVKKDGEIV